MKYVKSSVKSNNHLERNHSKSNPRYAIPLSFSPRECCLASKQKKKRISLDFKELFVLKQLERIEQQE